MESLKYIFFLKVFRDTYFKQLFQVLKSDWISRLIVQQQLNFSLFMLVCLSCVVASGSIILDHKTRAQVGIVGNYFMQCIPNILTNVIHYTVCIYNIFIVCTVYSTYCRYNNTNNSKRSSLFDLSTVVQCTCLLFIYLKAKKTF